jgi:hypothetical protein
MFKKCETMDKKAVAALASEGWDTSGKGTMEIRALQHHPVTTFPLPVQF